MKKKNGKIKEYKLLSKAVWKSKTWYDGFLMKTYSYTHDNGFVAIERFILAPLERKDEFRYFECEKEFKGMGLFVQVASFKLPLIYGISKYAVETLEKHEIQPDDILF